MIQHTILTIASQQTTCDVDSFCCKHCSNCFLLNCESNVCSVVNCPSKCGSRFHQCKLTDHISYICPETIVPCINSQIGCPLYFKRHICGKHLEDCPASIVHCFVEWNRWPRFLGEKNPFLFSGSYVGYKSQNSSPERYIPKDHSIPDSHLNSFHTDQFDLALSIRDQSILEKSMMVADRIKRSLQCYQTKLYPAIPMTSPLYHGAFRICADGSTFPLISSPSSVVPVTSTGTPLPYTSHKSQTPFLIESNFDPNLETTGYSPLSAKGDDTPSQYGRSLPNDDIISCMGDVRKSNALKSSSNFCSPSLAQKMSWAINDRILQVDCNMEFMPRYAQKPRAMFTFLCDQDIRRRNFCNHIKIHCDATAQADYWLEQRCPLAYLGCQFSAVRLRPNCQDVSLVYSPSISAFTTRPKFHQAEVLTGRRSCNFSLFHADPFVCWLDKLPGDIFLRITHFLDDVSLISVSKVSTNLGNVCKLLLPTRGIVTPMWRRILCQPTGLITWKLINFVWTFPFECENIQQWHISLDSVSTRISKHLSVCPFYEEVRAKVPFRLYGEEDKLFFS